MSQTIIITGAGSGIGKACAEAFLEAGWQVGLIGRRASPLEAVADGRDGALVLVCDVTDPDAVAQAFDKAATEWGRMTPCQH
jgi:Short-chain alcohol dehydrogenase of unknown specificity